MPTWSNDDPKKHIEKLLRVLCEPATPFTTQEVLRRLLTFDLDVVLPILEDELRSEPDVIRLVLGVLIEISEDFGRESIRGLLPAIAECLDNKDRLVRMSAIQLVRETQLADRFILDALRERIVEDEPNIRREAAVAVIELDDSLVERLPRMFGQL